MLRILFNTHKTKQNKANLWVYIMNSVDKMCIYRISFDFGNMEAMAGFYDTFKQTNNPNFIKSELIYSGHIYEENKTTHQFIVGKNKND